MNWLAWLQNQRRLVLTVAGLLSLTGAVAWLTMVRQEDPRLRDFWGQIVVSFPGADAELVERLVLEPIEDHLAEVAEINWVESTAYAEVAVVMMELRQDIGDTTEAWDNVREALALARREFPGGVGEAILNDELQEQESVVLTVTGNPDPQALLDAARELRHAILHEPTVAKVHLIADPGEQVTVEVDDATARRLGTTAAAVTATLASRSRIVPGGSLAVGGKTVRLRPLSEFQSVEEIAATALTLPSGAAVPLASVAAVRIGPSEPVAARMRFDGEAAVGVGVVPRAGVNLVSFGRAVRDRVAAVTRDLGDVRVEEMAFQPARVEARLSQLSRSLLFGVLIVAGVLITVMGLRLGLLVASVVPLVATASLAVFAIGGGVLHQISIAALVLALGMLVDNAIVMAEGVQWRLDEGEDGRSAATGAVRELAVPLAGATATTLAAFVPMLLSQGPTADFTRAIPVVVMVTITMSYLFAVAVTPALADLVLQRSSAATSHALAPLARRLAALAIRRSGLVVVAALVLVVAAGAAGMWVQFQFFPSSDRNQVVVDLRVPEGTHLDVTDAVARRLERALLDREEVTSVATFVGRSAPHFYYNLPRVPWSPHFAQLVVETRDLDDVQRTLEWTRSFAQRDMPEAEIVVRRLEQGPPVDAPVEVRLFADRLPDLQEAASKVAMALRGIPGTVDVRHDLGPGAPSLHLTVDDAQAARWGLNRADVARALYGHSRGLGVGELYRGDDPVPIVVRASAGEATPVGELTGLDVAAPDGRTVALGQVARIEPLWRPAAIKHRDRRRVVTVSSQLAEGFTFSDVLTDLRPRLEEIGLPAGIDIGFGGDAEGSGEANAALISALPVGAMLLLGVLLAEFNSFRRLAIVMITVPLAATGIVPGLLLAGQPFGFMSFLGVIALVGIVVNNAIVLLEVVESRRGEGASIDQALSDAIHRRLRPILLTSGTTVAGLLPLAFSGSTLWPALAWAMISGLLASTTLTLLVVPALYRLLFAPLAWRHAKTVAAALLTMVVAGTTRAETPLRVTLEEALARAASRPAVSAADNRATAAHRAAVAERRASRLPVVSTVAALSDRDRELELVTPIGSFPFGDARASTAALEVSQPLINVGRQVHASRASRAESVAAKSAAARVRQEAVLAAAEAFLGVRAVAAQQAALESYIASLSARLEQVSQLVGAGRALDADRLRVKMALADARHHALALAESRRIAGRLLAVALGVEGEVDAIGSLPELPCRAPDTDGLVASALASRPELTALIAAAEAKQRRATAVRAELLPRIDAQARWTWTDGSPYAQSSWLEGSLRIVWTPFASGTRGPRSAALASEALALADDAVETSRQVVVEVERAASAFVVANDALHVAAEAVRMAEETCRVERERYLAGRSTVSDLLAAEAEVHQRTAGNDLAAIETVRAWARLRIATGTTAVLP